MTVKELIEELSKVKNQDAPVYMQYGDKLVYSELINEIEPHNYYGYIKEVMLKGE